MHERSVFLSCPRLFEAIFAGRAAIGSPLAIWVFIALWVANGFSTGVGKLNRKYKLIIPLQ